MHLNTVPKITQTLKARGWVKMGSLWKSPHYRRQNLMTLREAASIEAISAPMHCFEVRRQKLVRS